MKRYLILFQTLFLLVAIGCSRAPQKTALPPVDSVAIGTKEVAVIPLPEKKIPVLKAKALVAIIIDDAGHNLRPMEALSSLPVRFNIAVLPRLKYSKKVARDLYEQGYEIMLHQPMEPKNSAIDPGPGAILVSMNAEEISKILEENFAGIPHLVGFNNHMGSKATMDQTVMEAVLRAGKKSNLFFIDSLTSASKVKAAAKVVDVNILTRDIFLDNERDLNKIKTQLRKLKKVALEKGAAIGIGHFYPLTIQAIEEILPEYEQDQVAIVPVSQFLE